LFWAIRSQAFILAMIMAIKNEGQETRREWVPFLFGHYHGQKQMVA